MQENTWDQYIKNVKTSLFTHNAVNCYMPWTISGLKSNMPVATETIASNLISLESILEENEKDEILNNPTKVITYAATLSFDMAICIFFRKGLFQESSKIIEEVSEWVNRCNTFYSYIKAPAENDKDFYTRKKCVEAIINKKNKFKIVGEDTRVKMNIRGFFYLFHYAEDKSKLKDNLKISAQSFLESLNLNNNKNNPCLITLQTIEGLEACIYEAFKNDDNRKDVFWQKCVLLVNIVWLDDEIIKTAKKEKYLPSYPNTGIDYTTEEQRHYSRIVGHSDKMKEIWKDAYLSAMDIHSYILIHWGVRYRERRTCPNYS